MLFRTSIWLLKEDLDRDLTPFPSKKSVLPISQPIMTVLRWKLMNNVMHDATFFTLIRSELVYEVYMLHVGLASYLWGCNKIKIKFLRSVMA